MTERSIIPVMLKCVECQSVFVRYGWIGLGSGGGDWGVSFVRAKSGITMSKGPARGTSLHHHHHHHHPHQHHHHHPHHIFTTIITMSNQRGDIWSGRERVPFLKIYIQPVSSPAFVKEWNLPPVLSTDKGNDLRLNEN